MVTEKGGWPRSWSEHHFATILPRADVNLLGIDMLTDEAEGQGWKGIKSVLVIFHLPFQVHPLSFSTHMNSIIRAPLLSDF